MPSSMDLEMNSTGIHNNNGTCEKDEPMLVEIESPAPATIDLLSSGPTGKIKKLRKKPANRGSTSSSNHHIEEPGLVGGTIDGAATFQEGQTFGQVVHNHGSPIIRKHAASDISEFIQPSNIFKRTFTKEKSNEQSKKEEHSGYDKNEEEAGHLDGWIEDVMEAISDPLLIKKESAAIADLCNELNRPRLVINRAQIKDHFGYEIDGTTYLWAEEALFLLETGKLDLYVDEVATSVERARALLLHSRNHEAVPLVESEEEILTCENDEYTVYKYFAKLGYRIRRRDSLRYSKKFQQQNANPNTNTVDADSGNLADGEDDVQSCTTDSSSMMDENQELPTTSSMNFVTEIPDSTGGSKRGTKRKAALGLISEDEEEESWGEEDESDSVKSLNANAGYTLVHDELMEEAGTTYVSESQYTVAEADDSDVEFVDEVIFSHSLVEIQELESSDPMIDDLENLPGPSTQQQRGPSPVIYDLVSSSDSECEVITNENIWSAFTSCKRFEMKFPPGHLLPENIAARSDNKLYTYDRTLDGPKPTGEHVAGMEEMEVEKAPEEEVKLNSSVSGSGMHEAERVKCDTWKEWRHHIMAEARDVRNESLLGARDFTTIADVTKKLHLWPPRKANTNTMTSNANPDAKLRIPFDLFPIVNRNVSKHQLWTSIQPLYHVAVVRTTDPVVSSLDMEAQLKSFNDSVPLLIALVDDDAEVLILSSDLKPLPSLF